MSGNNNDDDHDPGFEENWDSEDHPEDDSGADSGEEDFGGFRVPEEPYTLTKIGSRSYILKIGGRRWMLGMQWISKEEKQKRSSVQKEAKQIGATAWTQRETDEIIQVGYGSVERKSSMRSSYSLAAAIADGVQQPWFGVYQISENLYWYIAVRDQYAILPNSDFVGTYEEILEVKSRHAQFVYRQEKEGDLFDLAQLITETATRTNPLKWVDTNYWPWIALVAIALAAGTAYYTIHERDIEIQRAAALRAATREKAAENARLREYMAAVPPSPDLQMAMPDDMIEACNKAFSTIIDSHGWVFDMVQCNNQNGIATAVIDWKRPPAASLFHRPPGDLSVDGLSILQTIKLPTPQPTDNGAVDPDKSLSQLRGMLDLFGTPYMQFIWSRQLPDVIDIDQLSTPGYRPPPPPPPTSVQITMLLPQLPSNMDWNSIAGLRFQSIQSANASQGGGWNITAVIYGKEQPPIIMQGTRVVDVLARKTGLAP